VPETILVVDDEPDIAQFVAVNLRSEGYVVLVAFDGEEALDRAEEVRPDLVLLDVMMPKVDGFEVAQRIRRNPRTASTSIVMLTAAALSSEKVLGFSSGADDYIVKPFDPIELLVRVKTTLRRARDLRSLSPLTGLPGNFRIEDEIQRNIDEDTPFAVLYCDLDHFKAYNDHNGFVEGNLVLQATARILQEAVEEYARANGFVGHVGGDDFLVILPPDMADMAAARICERFDQEIAGFYDRKDLERGYIEVEDRQGNLQRFGLIAVSIGVATTNRRKFSHHGEAVHVATEMKQCAKRRSGSSFAVDRRGI
jgi:diguanylate cyclase (GGDEF)-like protein